VRDASVTFPAHAQSPQLEAAYVVLGPQGAVARAVLAEGSACPAITIDGTQRPMTIRRAASIGPTKPARDPAHTLSDGKLRQMARSQVAEVASAGHLEHSDKEIAKMSQFLGNLIRRVGGLVRRAAPVIGRIARAAAPLLGRGSP
jgi:hypothetical protein